MDFRGMLGNSSFLSKIEVIHWSLWIRNISFSHFAVLLPLPVPSILYSKAAKIWNWLQFYIKACTNRITNTCG